MSAALLMIESGDGDDFIIGGRLGDTIRARNGDNIILGDSARFCLSGGFDQPAAL